MSCRALGANTHLVTLPVPHKRNLESLHAIPLALQEQIGFFVLR